MRRVIGIARKEILHILRDPRSLAVAILMPAMMVLLFGFAINLELRDLPVGILDLDRSSASRELVRSMTSSGFIVNGGYLSSRSEIEPGFRHNRFQAALVIPCGYARSLIRNPSTEVQVLIDGADGATAATVDNYINAVIAMTNRSSLPRSLAPSLPLLEARIRYFFNPQLVSAHFIVPGLVALVMVMICAILTSITVAREKETGTMEQILTAPVGAHQIILGKVIPYILIGALDASLILAIGHLVLDVPMHGSWMVLAGYSMLYLLIALALGLLISTVARTQQVAMMLALITTLLPTLLLSGFIFDHSSMPVVLQYLSRIIPATYYLRVIRSIMLVGRNWFPLEGGVMLGMTIVLLITAVKRFKSRLE